MFKRVPPALLEEARERSFPVLAVPLGTAFRDIVGFINRSLLSSDLHTYQRLTAIQRHLVDALREPKPRAAMVERLARMLDAGVLLLDPDGAPECAAGPTPDPARVQQRLAEREFEEDGWHVVSVPIGANGWLAIASRGRLTARLARPAAQAAVPLLAATERLGELARDQERAVRSRAARRGARPDTGERPRGPRPRGAGRLVRDRPRDPRVRDGRRRRRRGRTRGRRRPRPASRTW